MVTGESVSKKKNSKKVKHSKIVSFDEEVVTKEQAKVLLSETVNRNSKIIKSTNDVSSKTSSTGKKNKHNKKQVRNTKKDESIVEPAKAMEIDSGTSEKDIKESKKMKRNKLNKDITDKTTDIPKKKQKLKHLESEETTKTDLIVNGESATLIPAKKTESIRERKRKKYAKLVEDKKLKTELALQQKSLNYLSKWKHSRADWKFEKLRQIWLQENMFNSDKIPDEFWGILVEYFSNSKGKARDFIVDKALKFIDAEENSSEGNLDIIRARSIIQNLHE